MSPISNCPCNRHERYIRIVAIPTMLAFLVPGQGCRNEGKVPGVENLKRERAAKPEGVLTVVRKLDLGTLPLHGKMELLLSVKNPTSKEISVTGYDIARPGLSVAPATFSIDASESMPVTIVVRPEATKDPGIHEWDIAAKTSDGELAFKTTLMLIVKDDVVVREGDTARERRP